MIRYVVLSPIKIIHEEAPGDDFIFEILCVTFRMIFRN
jgi:hypothetical protein